MQLLLPCSLESNVTVHATVDGMKGRKEGRKERRRKKENVVFMVGERVESSLA